MMRGGIEKLSKNMQIYILVLGITSLLLWTFVCYRDARSPLGWISPTCLFAAGILLFYIIPSLYWQLRTWMYFCPPYFEGLPLVLGGTIILGLPFLCGTLLWRGRKKEPNFQLPRGKIGSLGWLFLLPILFGIGWRIYLLSLGWQGRLAREFPSLMGSESLASIVHNFSCYHPAIYFLLIACGNKRQRRIGRVLWVIDGLLQLILLSRYQIIRFVLFSLVFSTLLRWKITFQRWIAVGILGVFVLSVIGWSHSLLKNYLSNDRNFLSPLEVTEVLIEGTTQYFTDDVGGTHISPETNPLLRSLDDTMYRLYDARSASAVMTNVPDVIPYFYGRTLFHVIYVFTPRYFWPEKPDLGDIHKVTNLVMFPEIGNPTGTVAELYMNFGFFAVLMGGVASFLLCRWGERNLARKGGIRPALLCMYPILSEQCIFASYNFTQRISESIRGLLVLAMIALLLRFIRNRPQMKNIKITHF